MKPLLFAFAAVMSLTLALAAGDGLGAWLMLALWLAFFISMLASMICVVSDRVDEQTK